MQTGDQLRELFDLLLEHYGPQHWWPADSPLEVMVGAVLTQNTNWTNVSKAIDNLKNAGALSLPSLARLPAGQLAQLIKPAGYFNIKAGRLHNLIAMILEQYDGDLDYMFEHSLEDLREALLRVKGVGPETADSILLYAAGKPVFVVDAYTFRILGRHGMAEESMSYFELQELFTGSLADDVDLFNEFHALLVILGKERCKKTKPLCSGCPAEHWASRQEVEF